MGLRRVGLQRVGLRWGLCRYAVVGMRMGRMAMIQMYRRIQLCMRVTLGTTIDHGLARRMLTAAIAGMMSMMPATP